MRIEDIEIHDGEPDRPYEVVGDVLARIGTRTPLNRSPSIEAINSRLREKAISMGANAVIRVAYTRGPIPSSWKGLTARGVAVRLEQDTRRCPSCAESIKRQAVRCKHCGAAVT